MRTEERWTDDLVTHLAGGASLAGQPHLLDEGARVLASTLGDPGAFSRARAAAALLGRDA